MLQYACSNPWCYQGSHYTPTCPYRRSPEPPPRYHPLSPEQARARAERQLQQMRRAEEEADRIERIRNSVPNPNDPPPVVQEPPGYGWRLVVFVPVALILLALLVFAFFQ